MIGLVLLLALRIYLPASLGQKVGTPGDVVAIAGTLSANQRSANVEGTAGVPRPCRVPLEEAALEGPKNRG